MARLIKSRLKCDVDSWKRNWKVGHVFGAKVKLRIFFFKYESYNKAHLTPKNDEGYQVSN